MLEAMICLIHQLEITCPYHFETNWNRCDLLRSKQQKWSLHRAQQSCIYMLSLGMLTDVNFKLINNQSHLLFLWDMRYIKLSLTTNLMFSFLFFRSCTVRKHCKMYPIIIFKSTLCQRSAEKLLTICRKKLFGTIVWMGTKICLRQI